MTRSRSAESSTVRERGPCWPEGTEHGPGSRRHGHEPPRGFVAEDAAERGRVADGAGHVAAKGQGPEAGCHGRRSAATGPSHGAAQAPRVVAWAAQAVLRGAPRRELGGVGLPHDDRARLLDTLHDDGVLGGDVVLEQKGAHRRADSLRGRQVLERDWDAVQQARRNILHERVFGVPGGGQRLVAADRQVGVQLGIDPLDAIKERLHRLHRRDFPRGDHLCQPHCGNERELRRHASLPGLLSCHQ